MIQEYKELLLKDLCARLPYEVKFMCNKNIYTTKGATCNFEFKDDTIIKMKSERESYDTNLWMLVRPITDSVDGKDRDTVESIRKKIPKQMLLRGSVTTTRDINNYFNFLNSDNRKLYFLEKIHNQIERLYYSYFLLKEDGINPKDIINFKTARYIDMFLFA